jgi:hypothetical protein
MADETEVSFGFGYSISNGPIANIKNQVENIFKNTPFLQCGSFSVQATGNYKTKETCCDKCDGEELLVNTKHSLAGSGTVKAECKILPPPPFSYSISKIFIGSAFGVGINVAVDAEAAITLKIKPKLNVGVTGNYNDSCGGACLTPNIGLSVPIFGGVSVSAQGGASFDLSNSCFQLANVESMGFEAGLEGSVSAFASASFGEASCSASSCGWSHGALDLVARLKAGRITFGGSSSCGSQNAPNNPVLSLDLQSVVGAISLKWPISAGNTYQCF